MIKKLHLNRTYELEQTLGEAYLYSNEDKLFAFKTLELPWRGNERNVSCISEGTYEVVRRFSQKYKHHLHITGVAGRSLILIHWGNYAGSVNPATGHPDIKGCILVGRHHKDIDGDGIKDITSSKDTFNKLMSYIEDNDVIELEIC